MSHMNPIRKWAREGHSVLKITSTLSIPDTEIQIHAIRAQGAGGQHVNKVSSAVHLRFDIHASSLPEAYKARLLKKKDSRITREGMIVIKAQRYRSQDKNREEARRRLQALIKSVTASPKIRRPTKPKKSAQQKRLDSKAKRSRLKQLRGKIPLWRIFINNGTYRQPANSHSPIATYIAVGCHCCETTLFGLGWDEQMCL